MDQDSALGGFANDASCWEPFNDCPNGLLAVGSDGTVLYVNQAYCGLAKVRAEEVVGRPFSAPLSRVAAVASQCIEQVRRTGKPVCLDKVQISHQPPVFWALQGWLWAAREAVILEARSILQTGPASQLSEGASGRMPSSESPRPVDEWLRLAVDAAELGTFYCPVPLGPIIWNDKCKEHFWLPPEAEIDFNLFYARLHKDDREATRQAIERALQERGTYDVEYRTVSPEGHQRWIRAMGKGCYDLEGKLQRFDGVTVDITEKKRAEEALASAMESAEHAKNAAESASKAKDQFLAALSHELRTPLTPVLALAESLKADPRLPCEIRKDMEVIVRNVALETRLIDDLLDVTCIEHGKVNMDLRPVDLRVIIREAVQICGEDLAEKKHGLELKVPERPCIILGDAVRLHQVVWNLLRNAIKFTPSGGEILLRMLCEKGSDLRSYVELEISDNGIGIDPELLPRLFMPFEQGHFSRARQFGGLGLGLTICKAVVSMHGGTIYARSEGRERGATFGIHLPIYEVGGEVSSSSEAATPALVGTSDGQDPLRILLVEDHEDTSRILARFFRAGGHEVATARTVASAIHEAENGEFDLLVSDLGLPDGMGLEVVRHLKHRQPAAKAIALSGYGMDEDVRRSKTAGFDLHLTKPIDIKVLKEAIRQLTRC